MKSPNTVEIPRFSESNHQLVQSLFHYSDQELLTLFQHYPEQGKYFTAIFCRYSPIVYSVIANSGLVALQRDYLFALTWREIFYEMRGLVLQDNGHPEFNSLQNWLIYMSASCLKQTQLPPDSLINYNLKAASPPLWCYLEQSLERLPPVIRFIIVMSENFSWTKNRIIAYLQTEGEMITPDDIDKWLDEGYQMLVSGLPEDIQLIYLLADN